MGETENSSIALGFDIASRGILSRELSNLLETPMKAWVRHLNGLISVLTVSRCPLCERPAEAYFCESCTRQLQACELKGQKVSPEEESLCIVAWGRYTDTLKRAIAALKYENHPELARPLGDWLASTWLALPQRPDRLRVVPIPMHASKHKQRGFNQAELIAEQFCDQTRWQGLMRHRETTAQFGLTATTRADNLKDAFLIGKECLTRSPDPVLLLDDIYTTGATVRSAAQTLRRQGIRVWGVAVVAQAALDRKIQ